MTEKQGQENDSNIMPSSLDSDLKNFIKYLPGCIYFKNVQGRYVACSNYLIADSRLNSTDEVVGKTDYDLFSEQQADSLRQNDIAAMQTGTPVVTEEVISLPNKTQQIFQVIKVAVKDRHGKIIGILGNSTNITALKETEAALKKAKEQAESANQAKTEFIKNMSHDIRTPLHGILGMARLLQMKEKDPKKLEYLHDQIESIKSLVNLQNEIIELIQLESYTTPLYQDTIDIRDLVEEIMILLQPEAICKKIVLKTSISSDVPKQLISDKMSLQRLLLNLAGNAVKFTKNGSVSIIITVHGKTDHNVTLSVVIEDSGIGIPPDKIHTIFDRFTRLNPSYEGNYKGSGLGLYIVKKTLDELGGSISVESSVGQGSTFTALIPLRCYSKRRQQTAVEFPKQRPRILLVEDDEICQLHVKQLAKELNYTLNITTNALAALEKLKEPYDVIIIDIGLPGIDGLQLTKKIRNELHLNTPIIATTAHAWEHSAAFAAGMNDLLRKPIQKSTFAKIIEKYLN